MAQPLDYTQHRKGMTREGPPKAETRQTAEEAWADVLETLHETETLRVLHGLVGQREGVEEVVLRDLLDTPRGRTSIKNLSALFNGVSALDTGDLEAVQDGLGKGLKAARRRFEDEDDPPGLIRLFMRLRDPDVRRALAALLALLKGLGGHLGDELGDSQDALAPRQ